MSTPHRNAERREQLLDAADQAIGKYGSEVSMAAIAAEAGITKPILYRHFGDKGGLYRALAERQTEELLQGIRSTLIAGTDVRERAKSAIDAYLAAIEKRPGVYRFVVDRAATEEPSVAGYVAHFEKRLAGELAAAFGPDLGVSTVRAQVWAHAIVGMVRAAGDWWLDAQSVSRSRLVKELIDLLFGGLAGEPEVKQTRSLRQVGGGRPRAAPG
jgi:AcrR family transcriptional regulator